MSFLRKRQLALGVVLCGVFVVMAYGYPGEGSSSSEAGVGVQDLNSLDRRISMIEQRFFSLEASINRLQQSALSQRPSVQSSVRDQEINLMRGTIQTLQLQLTEIECGLVKLDERTIPAAVREARKSGGARRADPCRLNPTAPLVLSTRP